MFAFSLLFRQPPPESRADVRTAEAKVTRRGQRGEDEEICMPGVLATTAAVVQTWNCGPPPCDTRTRPDDVKTLNMLLFIMLWMTWKKGWMLYNKSVLSAEMSGREGGFPKR